MDDHIVETPPQDFRTIEIIPSKHDLFHKPTFLKPNIINGPYKDVEHYLDVQFRLMREDFLGPLRESILEYKRDKNKKRMRYGSARFFRNCRILRDEFVFKIYFDKKLYKGFSNEKNQYVNMSSDNGFLPDSLLLLTKDNFENVMFFRIINSEDSEGSKEGVINASIESQFWTAAMINHKRFLMIISDIFWSPYFHIMEALQMPSLSLNFPFEKYIIRAEASKNPPKILQKCFGNLKLFNGSKMINGEWPPKENLNFNTSQYNAFKLALEREFVCVQGPPGTGKTYLGLKIVQTLLKNLYTENHSNLPPILIVCVTNHALDQFMEGLLSYTKKITRIGGQSKSKKLKNFNFQQKKSGEGPLREAREIHSKMDALLTDVNYYRNAIYSLDNCKEAFDVTDYAKKVAGYNFLGKFIYKNDSIPPLFNWLCGREKFTGDDVSVVISDLENLSLNDDSQPSKEEVEELDNIHHQRSNFDDYISHSKYRYNLLMKKYEMGLITQEFLTSEIQPLSHELKVAEILQEKLTCGDKGYNKNIDIVANQSAEDYNMEHRWALYWKWRRELKAVFQEKLRKKTLAFDETKKYYDELQIVVNDKYELEHEHIIGMTTSGAARRQSLLHSLKCPIVIVEEAAEVMESHIIVSLTPACSHLILIGDHQQLRPITGSYRLAKDFNLDVSLFERMFQLESNCARLETQHRMRPEISKLISPAIYPVLHDHESVQYFPKVLGVTKDVFFLDHNVFETMDQHSFSKDNEHEVKIALNLAKYLVQQCYKRSDITVLATYSAQILKMRKMQENEPHLKDVRIATVDSFQGEESKIIILSLVRSNPDGKIGFLSTVNRVCVALSRAKEGFYIIGNKSILIKHQIWENILGVLEAQNSVGDVLELKCQVHKNVTLIKAADDFKAVPEGGCSLICGQLLNCGHNCKKHCHAYDKDHTEYNCMEKCEKIISECNHKYKCQELCYETCKCMVIMEKKLECGHTLNLPCSINNCPEIIESTLPRCNHKVKHECYMDLEKVVCDKMWEERLSCGHLSTRQCITPNAECGIKMSCGHICEGMCHMKCDCKMCQIHETNYGRSFTTRRYLSGKG